MRHEYLCAASGVNGHSLNVYTNGNGNFYVPDGFNYYAPWEPVFRKLRKNELPKRSLSHIRSLAAGRDGYK